MPFVLRASPAANAAAVYSVPSLPTTDTAPLTDPYNNLSRVKFHSSFLYPYIVNTGPGLTRSGSVVFPNESPTGTQTVAKQTTRTLFAHGRGGTPMLSGYLVNRYGQTIELVGTTYIYDPDGGADNWTAYGGNARQTHGYHVDLAADDTNVYLVFSYNDFPQTRSQSDLTYTYYVRVFNDLVTGPSSAGTGGPLIEGNAAYVAMGRGRFDSRRRFLRRDDTATSRHPTSQTILFKTRSTGGLQDAILQAEFDAAGYYRQYAFLAPGFGTFSRDLTATSIGVTV